MARRAVPHPFGRRTVHFAGRPQHVAPDALWELGADIVPLGTKPDGVNINDDCGSTSPQLMREAVIASGADLGLALDGDADRLIVVDEKGELVDGDQLMALIALSQQKRGTLRGGGIVATVMTARWRAWPARSTGSAWSN